MNEQLPFFIVRTSLGFCSNPSDQGTEKNRPGIGQGTGKVEKKGKKEDLLGRIRTLEKRYQKFREEPPALSADSRQRWMRLCGSADSLLQSKSEELNSLEERTEKQRFFRDLDRTLQRLATRAQGMERAYEGKVDPHP